MTSHSFRILTCATALAFAAMYSPPAGAALDAKIEVIDPLETWLEGENWGVYIRVKNAGSEPVFPTWFWLGYRRSSHGGRTLVEPQRDGLMVRRSARPPFPTLSTYLLTLLNYTAAHEIGHLVIDARGAPGWDAEEHSNNTNGSLMRNPPTRDLRNSQFSVEEVRRVNLPGRISVP